MDVIFRNYDSIMLDENPSILGRLWDSPQWWKAHFSSEKTPCCCEQKVTLQPKKRCPMMLVKKPGGLKDCQDQTEWNIMKTHIYYVNLLYTYTIAIENMHFIWYKCILAWSNILIWCNMFCVIRITMQVLVLSMVLFQISSRLSSGFEMASVGGNPASRWQTGGLLEGLKDACPESFFSRHL